MKNFDDMVLHFLKDMYYAERAILKSLPELAAAAESGALNAALGQHAEETNAQVQRLEKVFAGLGKPAEGVTCEAVVGLMQETDDVLKGTKAGPVRDAALVACARALESYEVARYGAIAEWLGQKGHAALAAIAEQSLAQARQADARLGQLARQEINPTAAQA